MSLFTELNAQACNRLARQDGFKANNGINAYAEMMEFFLTHYKLPFKGILIKWDPEAQLQVAC